MKKKLILDIIMTLIFISLMKITFTGALFHEILGIVIFLLFILHKKFNIKWIKNIPKRFFKKDTSLMTKIEVTLNLLIFINVIGILISGLLISKELLGFLDFPINKPLVSSIHHSLSYITLILIGIHLGFHLKIIFHKINKKLKTKNIKPYTKILGKIFPVVIVVIGMTFYIQQGFSQKIIHPIKLLTKTNSNEPFSNKRYALSNNTTLSAEEITPDMDKDKLFSGLVCTICPKLCPLSRPKCHDGDKAIEEALADLENNELVSLIGSTTPTSPTLVGNVMVFSLFTTFGHYTAKVVKSKKK